MWWTSYSKCSSVSLLFSSFAVDLQTLVNLTQHFRNWICRQLYGSFRSRSSSKRPFPSVQTIRINRLWGLVDSSETSKTVFYSLSNCTDRKVFFGPCQIECIRQPFTPSAVGFLPPHSCSGWFIYQRVTVVFLQGDKGNQGRDGKRGKPGICDIKVRKQIHNSYIISGCMITSK